MHNIYRDKFYAHREPAWHGLGITSQEPKTAFEVSNLLGLPRVYTDSIKTSQGLPIPGYKAILGEDKEGISVYSVVSEEYHEITHYDFIRLWDTNTNHARVETLGLLGGGATMFLTAELPGFDIKGIEHKNYLLAVNPLTGKEAEYGRITPVRVVCQNTLNLSGGNHVEEFRATHTGQVIKELEKWLREVWETAKFKSEALQEAFNALASYRVSNNEASLIAQVAYPPPLDPKSPLNTGDIEHFQREVETQRDHRACVYNLFEGDGAGSQYRDTAGTAYGVYNAVCEYEQHAKKYGKQASIFTGAGARRTGAALNAALELVSK